MLKNTFVCFLLIRYLFSGFSIGHVYIILFNFWVLFKGSYLGDYNPWPSSHFFYGMRHFPKEKLAGVQLKWFSSSLVLKKNSYTVVNNILYPEEFEHKSRIHSNSILIGYKSCIFFWNKFGGNSWEYCLFRGWTRKWQRNLRPGVEVCVSAE